MTGRWVRTASGLGEVRARRALAAAGLDPTVALVRASSVTNEVFLTADHAVRINRRPGRRLHREAVLGPHLPPEVGYPPVVAYGEDGGFDWLVSERRPGHVLARCWSHMNPELRRSAIEQLARMLEALHQLPCPQPSPDVDRTRLVRWEAGPLSGSALIAPLLAAAASARRLAHVDGDLLARAVAMACEAAHAFPELAPLTLVHGDLTFENVLWDPDTDRVSAILDFEWSRAAPADLELDVLLRFCALPFLHVGEDYAESVRPEDYESVPAVLAEVYPELFSAPRLLDRLRLYSIAFDLQDLLETPPPRPGAAIGPYHPSRRLALTIKGRSYLDTWSTLPNWRQ